MPRPAEMKKQPTTQARRPNAPRALIDASSAILLQKAGLIRSCCETFHLLMTRSVSKEVSVPVHPDAAGLCALIGQQPGFCLLDDPVGPIPATVAADLGRLHRGERDTLHHYLKGMARFVIIDDGKGVQVCRRHNIPHVNALLCPQLIHFSGGMPDPHLAGSYQERIARLGRYSTGVIAWAQTCTRSALDFFINDR